MSNIDIPQAVQLFKNDLSLVIIDQTRLPQNLQYLRLTRLDEMIEAIAKLRVRGAPAIGIAAAYGLYVLAARDENENLLPSLAYAASRLIEARPTAVNLGWAVKRMMAVAAAHARTGENTQGSARAEGPPDFGDGAVYVRGGQQSRERLLAALLAEAEAIDNEDKQLCQAIGEHGLTLLKPGCGVLTHCNAGALATGGIGTALAPLYLAAGRGWQVRLYCDETRPLLQGARLTAWEMQRAGIDTTLICDNMAASLMAAGRIDVALVGCDRVARNGDIANKIGTLPLAIAAHYYQVPVYSCVPLSTLDADCASGADIVIEQRDGGEIGELWYAEPMAAPQLCGYNPAFDVVPAELITGYVTERGILKADELMAPARP
ncbi:MAG: S-methyl-5-thioribose-1-phosphate isomerase [Bacillota bacterium]|nr:S-methyl-5-thioribose-1-phosphate isomerase [Bacillota bacterium]